ALEVLETHALGPNRTLHLVRLGDRAVLVAATPERITQLMTVDDPGELMRLTEPSEGEIASRAVGQRTNSLASLRTGLRALNDRRRTLNERARAQREEHRQSEQPAPGPTPRQTSGRFASLRATLARPASVPP